MSLQININWQYHTVKAPLSSHVMGGTIH